MLGLERQLEEAQGEILDLEQAITKVGPHPNFASSHSAHISGPFQWSAVNAGCSAR